jgi:hypothetical protein
MDEGESRRQCSCHAGNGRVLARPPFAGGSEAEGAERPFPDLTPIKIPQVYTSWSAPSGKPGLSGVRTMPRYDARSILIETFPALNVSIVCRSKQGCPPLADAPEPAALANRISFPLESGTRESSELEASSARTAPRFGGRAMPSGVGSSGRAIRLSPSTAPGTARPGSSVWWKASRRGTRRSHWVGRK